jgi:DNA-binding LacI/PurR family transcriptional regulator
MAVSVVLNGSRSGTRVSEATRQRIMVAAGELGYRRNGLARSLKRGRTNILGFYRYFAPGPISPFHTTIVAPWRAVARNDHAGVRWWSGHPIDAGLPGRSSYLHRQRAPLWAPDQRRK